LQYLYFLFLNIHSFLFHHLHLLFLHIQLLFTFFFHFYHESIDSLLIKFNISSVHEILLNEVHISILLFKILVELHQLFLEIELILILHPSQFLRYQIDLLFILIIQLFLLNYFDLFDLFIKLLIKLFLQQLQILLNILFTTNHFTPEFINNHTFQLLLLIYQQLKRTLFLIIDLKLFFQNKQRILYRFLSFRLT